MAEEEARPNPIREKSYAFALTIVKAVRELQRGEKEYVLSKQLLRCGTSIGANVVEVGAAQSRADFIAKMSIASREARETLYWLRLMQDSQLLDTATSGPLIEQADELVRLLTSIVKTTRETNGS
jgi:four helix bundle protein